MTGAVIRVELLKLRRSPVGLIATGATVIGVLLLLAGITAGVAQGDPRLIAKAGPAASLDWDGLLAGAVQVVGAAGPLASGVVLAWIFGREFAEATITGLFALPCARDRIALAKLSVHALWLLVVATALTLGVLALGLSLGYGLPHAGAWAGAGRLWALVVLGGVASLPVAWIATRARSVLAAVGGAIGLVIIAQVGALAGAGAWLPPAAPVLWAMSQGSGASPVQMCLTGAFALVFAWLTCDSWRRLQLDH